MKFIKYLSGFLIATFLVLVGKQLPAFASTPDWSLNAPRGISFSCGGGIYNHTLNTISSNNTTGEFTGTGTYNPNNAYTWNISGNVSGNTLTFTLVYTGINSGYTLNGSGTIDLNGSISGITDGNCQTFSMPSGSANYLRSAEILSPLPSSNQSGVVHFTAVLHDDDMDGIQWAVRKGTCAANTGTVFGNVDGHSNEAILNQANFANQTFSFEGDMSGMEEGMYCFVYNPVEDGGESNIRLTSEFNLVLPLTTPADKDQCKKGGWENFNNPSFKNQGDCVSFVQSNKHAVANKEK